jgi:hypothetical protein
LNSLYILVIKSLSGLSDKDFLPFCGQPLQFRDHFFCCAETF